MLVTDSGGVQEETTYLGVPCLTVRDSTERPCTAKVGTNELVTLDPVLMRQRVANIVAHGTIDGQVPPLWDGQAAERIMSVLEERVDS